MRLKFRARILGARVTAIILTLILISVIISMYPGLGWANDDDCPDDGAGSIRKHTRRFKWFHKFDMQKRRWNSRCSKPISTPSPATLLIFATGIVGVVGYYRIRKSK